MSSSSDSATYPIKVTRGTNRQGKIQDLVSSLEDVQNESTVTDAKKNARAFIHMMERSNLIVSLNVGYHVPNFTKPLTLALQSPKCDRYLQSLHRRTSFHPSCRRTEEVFRCKVGAKATAIGDSLDIEITHPRTTGRMRHRAKTDSVDTESYYRINVFFPFFGHCLNELGQRFSNLHPSFLAFKLVPC